MVINNYRPVLKERKEKKRGSILKWILFGILLLGVGGAIAALVYEAKTSKYQAREISRYAANLTYTLEEGPSDAISFPKNGPFDTRLGYAQLPQFLERARGRGLEVEHQARFSPALMEYTSHGLFTPYPEKTQAGLVIVD